VLFNIFAGVIFTYVFLWTANAGFLPENEDRPHVYWVMLAVLLPLAGSATVGAARRVLGSSRVLAGLLVLVAAMLVLCGCATIAVSYWTAGLRPDANSYGATVFTLFMLAGAVAGSAAFLCLYTIARILAGKLDARRRLTFEVTAMLYHYAVAQSVMTVGFVFLMPGILGG